MALGKLAVDYEQRVDYDRLRRDKKARHELVCRQALDALTRHAQV